jgi:hypothetical protein
MAQFDAFDVMSTTVGADVATNGTITFTYPTKSPARAAASYVAAAGAKMYTGQGHEGAYLQQALGFSMVYGATTVVVTYLGLTTIPAGTVVRLQSPLASYADITDSSTGAIVAALAAGAGVETVSLPVDLTSFTTGALDLVTTYLPGYKFKLLDVQYVANKVATGAGATQALQPKITGVAVTGGLVTPTLANAAVMGVKVAGTAVTALNTGSATDTISVSAAAGGVVFTAGSGVLLLKIQNMDTADGMATINAQLTAINALLRAREIFPGQAAG